MSATGMVMTRRTSLRRSTRSSADSRGAPRLSALERVERLNEVRLVMTMPVADITYEIETGLRKVIYEPVIEALAADKGSPKRIGDLADDPKLAKLPAGALIEALAVMVG